MGKVRGPHPLRDECSHPGVPRRCSRHAGRPVNADGDEQFPRLGTAAQRPPDEGKEADRLHRRRRHHPTPVRPQPAHGQRRHQLQHGPDEQRSRGRQPGRHRAESEGQSEGRDVVLPAADHHAVGGGVGGGDPEIAAEPRPGREASGEKLHDLGAGPRRAGGQREQSEARGGQARWRDLVYTPAGR